MITDKQRLKRKQYLKGYYLANRDKIKARVREYVKRNSVVIAEKKKSYADRNKDNLRRYKKDYYLKHSDHIKAKSKRWYFLNRKRARIKQSSYRHRRNELERKRRREDLDYRIKMNLRGTLARALKQQDTNKCYRAETLLGCSIKDFKIYIESRFQSGMNWKNYGLWELDHIVPCAIFKLSDSSHQKRCFHFSNYQPLWEIDNQRKHTSVLVPQYHLPI